MFVKRELQNANAVRQTKGVKVDVKTLDDKPMTAQHATEPVGSALRIAPGFVATTIDDDAGIETTIEAHYLPERGRYMTTMIRNRAISPTFDERRLKHTPSQAIVQAAVPHCMALQLDEQPGSNWTTVADLNATEGRIIPMWLAQAVTKHGVKDERWEVIEILYGTATLADLPPGKLIETELGIPTRTATYWIQNARAAGRLVGMASNVGRPAGG